MEWILITKYLMSFVKIRKNCGNYAGKPATSELAGCHKPVLVRVEESADNVTDCKLPLAAAPCVSRERRTVMDGTATRRSIFRTDFVIYEVD